MICMHCGRDPDPSHQMFCYWCGQPVCTDCVVTVQLPGETAATVCPGCRDKQVRSEAADASMWEITVEAVLAGHDLGAWEVTNEGTGWQARCRRCETTAWVGRSGVMYSLLAASCLPVSDTGNGRIKEGL